ncbi:MAG: GNAT family protein [Vagococcus sp.]
MNIETKRLLIRQYEVSDSKEASTFLLHPEAMHYIPETFETVEEVTHFLQENRDAYFPVCLKETGEIIGHLFFKAFFGSHSYEIGWIFHPDYHRKGYAKEAAEAVLAYGFLKKEIHRVIATCQPENEGSWRLMDSLGMRREGYFKQCIPKGDTWWDEYYYAILKEEWHQLLSKNII